MRLIDLTGKRFGRLVVVGRAANKYGKTPCWSCVCDCGGTLVTAGTSLKRGATSSCGCLRMNDHAVPTYELAHLRVKNAKGRAADHQCVDCGKPASHWSYIGGDPDEATCDRRRSSYSLDPSLYVPRCVSCHKLHDLQISRSA